MKMEKYQFSAEERRTLESLPQAFAVYQMVDDWIETLLLSDGFLKLFGYADREEALRYMDKNIFSFYHPDDTVRIQEAARRFAEEEGRYDVYYRTRQRAGSEYMVIHASGQLVHKEGGATVGYVWYTNEGIYTRDADKRDGVFRHSIYNALHEESLVRASRYDGLTGLYNMTYFFEAAETWKKSRNKESGYPTLLYFNLHGMKIYNTRNSFAEGDRLLKAFAGLLEEVFSHGHCCHIAADQFAAFSDEENLEEMLFTLFQKAKDLNDGNSLPVHVGVYSSMFEDVPVSMACDRAKFACDELKNSYESGFYYYDNNLRDEAFRKQYILSHLDQAIEERWIQVYYQALVRAVNGKVSDEEALARWVDPERGILSPIEFIPFLEEAGVIYKLDLCVVDQVLEKLHMQEEAGCFLVPQSVNLSRADFDGCDIVEEIRKRVDASGIPRDLITIEITESTVGSDADFMKSQIDRFRELGFPVWLDDFGSGYSSLEVLQTIRVDLLKFDMSFMQRLHEGIEGKIILTELMRMATSLGLDTACEGVETEEQVRFLRDIGCSKLQGYYYTKPVPLETLMKRYKEGLSIGYEDPEEVRYYEAIGRANLYDLGGIVNEDDSTLQKTFNSLPMGIIETNEVDGHFIRSNQSYRDFMSRIFAINLSDLGLDEKRLAGKPSEAFIRAVRQCGESDRAIIMDEELPDGSVIHSLTRKIAENPKKGQQALAVAVLSVSDKNEGATYADIARALAADYYNIYYVNLDTDQFIEYSSPVGGLELAVERHGEHFFDAVQRDTMTRIYEKDREFFLTGFTKEKILKGLEEHGVLSTTYRLIDSGEPMYVNMKITQMNPRKNALIIGISIIDSQMKRQEKSIKSEKEADALAGIMALTGDYHELYTIDPASGAYIEYIPAEEDQRLGLSKQGEDFFAREREEAARVVYPEDLEFFLQNFTKENILREIEENHQFQLHYRFMINGIPKKVSLKIVPVREKDGERLLAGIRVWRERR